MISLGCEVRNELVNVVVGAFGHVELARRNVEERHTGRLPAEVDRSEEGVFLVGGYCHPARCPGVTSSITPRLTSP